MSPQTSVDLPVEPSRTLRISPMLATDDMERTLLFYQQVLQFKVFLRSTGYSIVERNGLTIHFQCAASEAVMEAMRKHTEIYIEVDDIGPLWTHVSQYREQYRIRDLFERDYGMTEFHIADPNGILIFVGQITRRA